MGVATTAEAEPETLYERMHREIVATASVVIGRAEIGAWCRI